MIVRYSPYNSPFVSGTIPGVYWVPLECRSLPHDAHVHCYLNSLPAFYRGYSSERRSLIFSEVMRFERARQQNILNDDQYSELDFLSKLGVNAASRRLGRLS